MLLSYEELDINKQIEQNKKLIESLSRAYPAFIKPFY